MNKSKIKALAKKDTGRIVLEGSTFDPDEAKGAVAWMANHSVAANLIMLLCIVGGLLAIKNIKQEVFPDLTLDIVNVTVSYPGASPEEVRESIIQPIENAVNGLDGVEEINSSASEGSGTVAVELVQGSDLQRLSQDIKTEVDGITTFPEEAEEPTVSIESHSRQVLSLIIYGNANMQTLHTLAERARDELLQKDNITQVEIAGIKDLEIKIEVPQENLRRYGLTISDVASKVAAASVDVPGGGLKTEGGEILVRVMERRNFGQEFAELPIISTSDGSQVLLGDIAIIQDDFSEDSDSESSFDNKPAVMLDVYRVGDQTPIEVSDEVRKFQKELDGQLPKGIKTAIRHDMSETYKQRIELLLNNGALGLVLVLIILGLFLEIKLAFWVMMGIPISFLGSLLIMPAMGVSLNMITLFAYIIALGIVVDDAIVVGENIYHYRQRGKSFFEASILGAKEVAMPVTFSILTNCVAFMPLYFVPGVMGKIFYMIPIVVCSVFIISLLESIFVLPAHLGHQKKKKRKGLSLLIHQGQQGFSHWFVEWINTRYGPALHKMLKWRYATVAVGVAILLFSLGLALSGKMGFSMFPKVESDRSVVQVTMPYGVNVAKTKKVADYLYKCAKEVVDESGHPELVEGISTRIGSASHSLRISVSMADPEIRDKIMSTGEFTRKWREKAGDIVGPETIKFQDNFGGPGSGEALTVELSHSNMETLEKACDDLAKMLEKFPRVKDIDPGYQSGKEQLNFTLKPEGKSLGLTAQSVASQIRSSFYGAEAIRQQRGRNEIKIMVRLPKDERSTEDNIEELIIKTPDGKDVMLREVVNITRGRAYTQILQRNGRTVISVTADVTPADKAGDVIRSLKEKELPALKKKYPGLNYGFEGRQADERESMASLISGFVIAILVIYIMLAIPFHSYIQPLIVMVSIPFGIVGAIFGHLIMGYSLSLVSVFGIVALAGVVVNDSLVLIERANRLTKDFGMSPTTAIYNAAISRFRPILLTTLTTFFGLAPMIMERSLQARFLIPMAISLGFGVLFATFITLALVPALYLIINDIRSFSATHRRKLKQ